MKASAVIGMNFGDEGKGLITDYLCNAASRRKVMVVRFNGGAQAGHTVVTPYGKRHVFHTFGSGTFSGASTYLSRYFVVNPWPWLVERNKLRPHFPLSFPPMFVDREAPLGTHYDMLINQELERIRAGGKGIHGSCGLGINETITRNQTPFETRIGIPISKLLKKLDLIRDKYAVNRIARVTGEQPGASFMEKLYDRSLTDSYLETLATFTESVTLRDLVDLDLDYPDMEIVFEGAQGLLLDEDHFFFPNVTRSKTGLTNVLPLCAAMGIEDLDVYYVTRTYMTRHGAGLFPTEDPSMSFSDDTNVDNPFQGSLRFGTFDFDLMSEAVEHDLHQGIYSGVRLTPSIALTHLDQSIEDPRSICRLLKQKIGLFVSLTSHGPKRNDVMEMPQLI